MYLKHLTWRETEQYLQQKQSIIMPIGSHEQHGPNGMIGTDIIVVRVAEDLPKKGYPDRPFHRSGHGSASFGLCRLHHRSPHHADFDH